MSIHEQNKIIEKKMQKNQGSALPKVLISQLLNAL